MSKLTKAQEKALEIVRRAGPVGGARFGRMMWPPDRENGQRRKAQGSGFAGGGYLAKLAKVGLVRHVATAAYCAEYIITDKGREALREQS